MSFVSPLYVLKERGKTMRAPMTVRNLLVLGVTGIVAWAGAQFVQMGQDTSPPTPSGKNENLYEGRRGIEKKDMRNPFGPSGQASPNVSEGRVKNIPGSVVSDQIQGQVPSPGVRGQSTNQGGPGRFDRGRSGVERNSEEAGQSTLSPDLIPGSKSQSQRYKGSQGTISSDMGVGQPGSQVTGDRDRSQRFKRDKGVEKSEGSGQQVQATPPSGEMGSSKSSADQKREQLRHRLEQLKTGGKQEHLETLPAGGMTETPSISGDTKLTREELKQKLEERKRKGGPVGTSQNDNRGVQVSGEQTQNQSDTQVTPPSGQPQGRLTRDQLKQKLEERKQGRTGEWGQGKSGQLSGQETPAQGETQATPAPGQQQGKLTKEQLRQRVEELRKQKLSQQTPAQGGIQGTPAPGQQQGKLTKEQLRQQVEELRKQKLGQQTPPTGATPTPTQQGGQQGAQDVRKQRFEQLRQERAEKFASKLPPEEKAKLQSLFEQSKGKDLREVVQKLKQEQGATAQDKEALKAKIQELRRMHAEERAKLVGANVAEKQELVRERFQKRFTAEDVQKQLGNAQGKPRIELNKEQLRKLEKGEVPPPLRPHGDLGIVRRPLEREFRYVHERWYCPPPPPRRGYGVDFVGFHWEYWDGRYRYDHHWAINIFINVGHTRYDGYDGIIVGGRYFCYGWGWIDGCIDYGDCRIWVPGFWAPYTVTECCECEVWVPPVYDWVWTGCCWEQIQVSGGYFVRQPSGCHTVTRYRWVPGHFEYYRC